MAEVVAVGVGEQGLQNDDWRERHDRGPNLLDEVARHRILDHIAWKEVPMTAVAAKVVLVLDGLEVVNVEIPNTERKNKAENGRPDVQDTRRERREVREHGGRTSEMTEVERREAVGKQQTMVEGRLTEARANGILQADPPCRSSNRSWHVSSPTAGRASR